MNDKTKLSFNYVGALIAGMGIGSINESIIKGLIFFIIGMIIIAYSYPAWKKALKKL